MPGGLRAVKAGKVENLIGEWMGEKGNRNSLFLATKVGFPTPVDDLDFGLKAGQIERACEASLKRLNTDRIDLYYMHNDDRHAPVEERLEACHRLVKAGKVLCVGASNTAAWRIEEARGIAGNNGWPEYCCIQQRYSYLRPAAGSVYDPHAVADDELLDYCRNRGITLLAYSPLLQGAYVRSDKQYPQEYYGKDTDTRIKALKAVGEEYGVSEIQVVLAWLMQSEPKVIPIITASKVSHLQQNIEARQVKLSDAQLEVLSQAGNIRQQNPFGQRTRIPGMKEG